MERNSSSFRTLRCPSNPSMKGIQHMDNGKEHGNPRSRYKGIYRFIGVIYEENGGVISFRGLRNYPSMEPSLRCAASMARRLAMGQAFARSRVPEAVWVRGSGFKV